MNKVTSGGANTAVGNVAMANATSGSFNVLVGAGVGLGSTMGDFNTFVGANAFALPNGTSSLVSKRGAYRS